MYVLDPSKKADAERRWSLPDRIFFGHGACHILAGVFLEESILAGFRAHWLVPHEGYSGNHVYVTDGEVAFDYHGYSRLERLLAHHKKVWHSQQPGWSAEIQCVDFSLLSTEDLNLRDMRGPDQYFGDPIVRARQFLGKMLHDAAADQARALGAVEGAKE